MTTLNQGDKIEVTGVLRTIRGTRKNTYVMIEDETTSNNVEALLERFAEGTLRTGQRVKVSGEWVDDPLGGYIGGSEAKLEVLTVDHKRLVREQISFRVPLNHTQPGLLPQFVVLFEAKQQMGIAREIRKVVEPPAAEPTAESVAESATPEEVGDTAPVCDHDHDHDHSPLPELPEGWVFYWLSGPYDLPAASAPSLWELVDAIIEEDWRKYGYREE